MTSAPEPGGSPRPSLAVVLTTLCLTEIVSWGLLFFTFPVLAPMISADTGWSSVSVSAAFSVAMVVQGLVGVQVGTLLDRYGPRQVMTVGSAVAAAALVIVSIAPNLPVFFAGWALAGLSMAGVLYAPAFAAITVWFDSKQLTAMTALTLIAGLASTVFAPLAAASGLHLGWRTTYLLAAAAMAVVTLPLHWIVLRRPWPAARRDATVDRAADKAYTSGIVRSARFWLLTIGFTTVSAATGSALLALVPLLLERGISAQDAALVLGMGGVGQVTGRIFYMALARRASLLVRTATAFLLQTAAIAIISFATGSTGLFIAIWIAYGLGLGITTLLRATAITDRWGPRSYGYLNGVLGLPSILASALSPLAGAVLAQLTGSYGRAFVVLAILAVVGTALMIASTRGPGPRPITVTG